MATLLKIDQTNATNKKSTPPYISDVLIFRILYDLEVKRVVLRFTEEQRSFPFRLTNYLLSNPFTFATTFSTVNPYSLMIFSPGADAPN